MPQNPVKSTLLVTQLLAGVGVTLSPANGTGLVTVSASGEVSSDFNTNITTVGAGVLTAIGITGGVITRTGSVAAFTDTTATAVAIAANIPNAQAGQAFYVSVINKTAFPQTITNGVGVVMSGTVVIPGNSTGRFLVTLATLTAVTMQGIGVSSNLVLPAAKFTTAALAAGAIPAASIVGASMCYWENTGATPGAQTFPTAATLFAAIPNAYVGMTSTFRIINKGAGTLTLTADAGPTITIAGTATVAQNVTRDYMLTFTSATAATVQSVGSGVSP